VDGDVEGQFDDIPWQDIPLSQFVHELDPTEFPMLTTETVTALTQSWMSNIHKMDRPFNILVIRKTSETHVIFICSTAIADELTLSFISKEIFTLYSDCMAKRLIGESEYAITSYLNSLESKEEADDFIDFAYALTPSRKGNNYWKDLCIETVQDTVEGSEKNDIEGQLRKLIVEIESLRSQLQSLTKRKAELDVELSELKRQRMQIDIDSSGPVEIYIDPSTGESIEVSKAAKAAILKVVLGNEAVEDNVMALLSKHEVPMDVQNRLGTSTMTLESFSSISEDQLITLGLLTKDRRKILALSEYVRNRIKESLQEQTKVKFALERKILKIQREFDTVSTNLKSTQNSLDINDDMALRLRNILRPPSMDVKILPLQLESSACSYPKESPDYAKLYGFVAFELDRNIVRNMRIFRDGCKQSQKIRKAQLRRETLLSRSADSDFSSADESNISDNDGEDPRDVKAGRVSSTDSVCLAAFAVLLKHISGSDKFLIGLNSHHRQCGVLVGPLSSVVPVKIDLGEKGMTFNSLLASIQKSLRDSRKYAAECPFSTVAQKCDLDDRFAIQFEYISQKDSAGWRYAGLNAKDILSMHDSTSRLGNSELRTHRVWSIGEHSTFDIKVVIVEDSEDVIGGIQFRRDRFDDDKVTKWAAKYLTTLEGIEFGPRKLAISSMISRYIIASIHLFCAKTNIHPLYFQVLFECIQC
jgi:flagellar motor switch/type III secretory pathway protein FliN